MDSKNVIILILGLLAMFLLISSEVSARDLRDTSSNTKNVDVEKIHEDAYGYKGHNGVYRSIGHGFPSNNGGYFGGYLGNGGRYNGGFPYHNGGYVRGFPINIGDYSRRFPIIVGGYNGGYRGNGGGYNVGYNGGYRGNGGGYNVGYGHGYPGRIGSYIGGPYIAGYGNGYLSHGSLSGEVVGKKTKDNTHN